MDVDSLTPLLFVLGLGTIGGLVFAVIQCFAVFRALSGIPPTTP